MVCPYCFGFGHIPIVTHLGQSKEMKCEACDGTGKKI